MIKGKEITTNKELHPSKRAKEVQKRRAELAKKPKK